MSKYRLECEAKFKLDLESEIKRMKEYEISRIRIEEASKARQNMSSFRSEMDQLYQDKIKELKIRETETLDRIKSRERDLDKASFEHR